MGIHHQNLAGTNTALGHDIFALVAMRTYFRSQGDESILGFHPTRRAQAIAIQQAYGVAAVREHNTGGAIPWLHMHGVIFVKGLQVRIHGLDILPGGRHQHAQGPRHIHPASHQHVQHIIQAGRVRTGAVDQWGDILDIG